MLRAALATLVLAALTTGCGKTTDHKQTAQTSPAKPASNQQNQTSSAPTIKTNTGGKPLTQAQWLAEGNAICAKTVRQMAPLKVKSVSEIPRLLPQELIYVRSEIAALAKLTPPADKAKGWQELVNLKNEWANGAAQMAANPELLRSESPLLRAMNAVESRANRLARREGFNQCALS